MAQQQLNIAATAANGSVALSPLQQYAKDVTVAADTISLYCTENGLPQPSFDASAPSVVIPHSAPLAVQDARRKLIASVARIQQLATEPAEYLPTLQINYQVLSALGWLIQFDILSKIPTGDSISYTALAASASVPESQLRSVARMAMTSNFLREARPGHVAHNAVSTLFVSDVRYVDWAKFMTRFSAPTAGAFGEATRRWGVTDRKNETAFSVATGTDGPLFEYFARSDELAGVFSGYMKAVQSSHGTSLQHLVDGFDWAALGDAEVVDVGGSTCSCSVALATAYPSLRFTVEDLPETVAGADKILSGQPAAVRARIATRASDFFTPRPAHTQQPSPRVFLLRMILHDWPRAHALTILGHLLPALVAAGPAARLVIMDTVLPPPGAVSPVEEALLRVRDLTMIQSFNSKERELGEFEALFNDTRDADGRLVLKAWNQPPGSVLSVMEVAYERFEGAASNL